MISKEIPVDEVPASREEFHLALDYRRVGQTRVSRVMTVQFSTTDVPSREFLLDEAARLIDTYLAMAPDKDTEDAVAKLRPRLRCLYDELVDKSFDGLRAYLIAEDINWLDAVMADRDAERAISCVFKDFADADARELTLPIDFTELLNWYDESQDRCESDLLTYMKCILPEETAVFTKHRLASTLLKLLIENLNEHESEYFNIPDPEELFIHTADKDGPTTMTVEVERIKEDTALDEPNVVFPVSLEQLRRWMRYTPDHSVEGLPAFVARDGMGDTAAFYKFPGHEEAYASLYNMLNDDDYDGAEWDEDVSCIGTLVQYKDTTYRVTTLLKLDIKIPATLHQLKTWFATTDERSVTSMRAWLVLTFGEHYMPGITSAVRHDALYTALEKLADVDDPCWGEKSNLAEGAKATYVVTAEGVNSTVTTA